MKAGVANVKWEPLEDGDDPFNTYEVDEFEVDDAEFVDDVLDTGSTLEIENRNPSGKARKNWKETEHDARTRGILWVQFLRSATYYGFPCPFGKYLEFQEAGFSSNWFNSNFTINYVGDWGWPWGRTRPAGYAPGFGFYTI